MCGPQEKKKRSAQRRNSNQRRKERVNREGTTIRGCIKETKRSKLVGGEKR